MWNSTFYGLACPQTLILLRCGSASRGKRELTPAGKLLTVCPLERFEYGQSQ